MSECYPYVGQRVEFLGAPEGEEHCRSRGWASPTKGSFYTIRSIRGLCDHLREAGGINPYIRLVEISNPTYRACCGEWEEAAFDCATFRPVGGTETGMETLRRTARDVEWLGETIRELRSIPAVRRAVEGLECTKGWRPDD